MAERVLLVDDEEAFLEVTSERLRARGMEVATSSSAPEALAMIEQDLFDAVVLDLKMPGMDGLEALKRIRERRPDVQVILLTGHGTLEKAVEAIKRGAMDFIEKPADLDAIANKIRKAKQKRVLITDEMNKENILEMLRRFGV